MTTEIKISPDGEFAFREHNPNEDPFGHIPVGLLSSQTLKVYRSVWRRWREFVERYGEESFPVDGGLFAEFIRANKAIFSGSHIDLCTDVMRSAHKYNGLKAPAFPFELTFLRREVTLQRRVIKQAPPLRFSQVIKMCETVELKVRDRAMVSFMYDALLRRSDVLKVQWCDFCTEDTEWGSRAYVRIWETKGKWILDGGEKRTLSQRTMRLLVEYYQEQKEKGDLKEKVFPFHHNVVDQTFARISKALGKKYTTHSSRVGAVTDMLEAGISDTEIAINGGWSSTAMVRVYARNERAGKSAMTKLMDNRREEKYMDSIPEFVKERDGVWHQ